jgi:hypothetical protein
LSSYLSAFVKRFDTDPAANPINQGGISDLVAASPNMIKVFGSPAQAKWAHNKNKTLTVIVRDMSALEDPFQGMTPSADVAVQYWSLIQPYLGLFPKDRRYVFNVWPNEPPVDPDYLKALSAYYVKLAQLATADGRVIAGGAFSAEVRLWDKWQGFADALEALRAGGHFLDLHGYAPDMSDPKYAEFLYPWRNLRAAMASSGRMLPRIIAGEFGIDDNLSMGVAAPGYRTRFTNEQYASALIAAGPQLAADQINAFVFWASAANDGEFQMYNINIGAPGDKKHDPDPSVWDRITPWIASQQSIVEVPAPPPQPPVPPISGVKSVLVTAQCNQRAGASKTSQLLGVIDSGAHFQAEYPAVNGYNKIAGQDFYLLSANLKLQ